MAEWSKADRPKAGKSGQFKSFADRVPVSGPKQTWSPKSKGEGPIECMASRKNSR